MIPLGGFGLFLRGFNVGIVGYQIRVVLGVTESLSVLSQRPYEW